jgi:hypothetical protein
MIGPDGKTQKLCELLHTGRDYFPLLTALQFVVRQLSCIKAARSDDPGWRMASRELYPGYVFSDKCIAALNSISMSLNAVGGA